MFSQVRKLPRPSKPETVATIVTLNEYYKNCCVYMLASVMIICSLMFYISYWRQYIHLKRRRELLRRTNQRIARPHRPYAIHREHEVFHKIMAAVRQYQQQVGERRPAVDLSLSQEFQDCQGTTTTNNELN